MQKNPNCSLARLFEPITHKTDMYIYIYSFKISSIFLTTCLGWKTQKQTNKCQNSSCSIICLCIRSHQNQYLQLELSICTPKCKLCPFSGSKTDSFFFGGGATMWKETMIHDVDSNERTAWIFKFVMVLFKHAANIKTNHVQTHVYQYIYISIIYMN